MQKKIAGILVVFFGFGIIFSSGISTFFTESQYDDDIPIEKDIDDTQHEEKPDQDKDKDNDVIVASIRLNPHTLNLNSKGKWITVYIELPEGYSVENIDLSTVLLNNEIPAEEKPTQIYDFDNDNLLDLMVKFDRSSLITLLKLHECHEVIVSGKLNNQKEFKGIWEISYR
ncbi:MAG: hypothetical protein EAX91_04660 [Candidatus Lokiarchaeota archaeon]|nr:hypothetical protein [Candidatus Lokiarchaeota archaeon]